MTSEESSYEHGFMDALSIAMDPFYAKHLKAVEVALREQRAERALSWLGLRELAHGGSEAGQKLKEAARVDGRRALSKRVREGDRE